MATSEKTLSTPAAQPESPVASSSSRLRTGSVPLSGAIAEAVGAVSPEISVSFAIVPVAVFAGAATPAALVIAAIGALAVAGLMAYLSNKHSDAGGLSSLVGRSLGGRWGVAAGFALSIFVVTSVASGVTVGTIATTLYSKYAPHSHNILSDNWIIWAFVFTAAALALAYLGIRPAVRVLLVVSAIGGVAFLIMIIFVLAKGGANGIVWSGLIPFSQGVSTRDFIIGVGVAFGPFTGMEAATFLGEESVHPKRHIPIATIGVVVMAGVFYVLFSLAMITGYGSSAAGQKAYLTDGFTSILVISSKYVSPWFGTFLLWIVLVAAFTFTLAIINEGGRLLYRWGKDGVISHAFERTSKRFHTPTVGLLALAVIATAYYLLLYAWKGGSIANTVEIATYVSLLVTVTVLISYAFVGVAGAVEGWRSRAHPVIKVLLPVVAIAIIGLSLYNEFVPAPAAPYGSAPYVGLGIVVAGAAVGLWRVDRGDRKGADIRTVPAVAGSGPASVDSELTSVVERRPEAVGGSADEVGGSPDEVRV